MKDRTGRRRHPAVDAGAGGVMTGGDHVPFTMLKRISVATGLGLAATALFGARATRDQAAADRWNRTRLARGVTVGGRRVKLEAPRKVGARGARGRWQFQERPGRGRQFRRTG
jgi:hypothetical protein